MSTLLGKAYESSGEEDAQEAPSNAPASAPIDVLAAPDVSLEDPMRLQLMLNKPTDTTIAYNVPYADLAREVQGPANPFKKADGTSGVKRKNVLTGHAEEIALSDAAFTTQNRTFKSLGYAQDPSGNGFIGDLASAKRFRGIDSVQNRPSKDASRAKRALREDRGDASIVDGPGAYKGPFAAYRNEFQSLETEVAEEETDRSLASDEEYVEEGEPVDAAVAAVPLPSITRSTKKEETTIFHGEAEHDYLGRTYMHIPQDLGINLTSDVAADIQSFIPKKHIYTFTSPPSSSSNINAHTGPITALRFLPHSGHLLLSASADTHVKLWDCYHSRSLLRTFSGHTRAISDATFSPLDNGRHFLTASYDLQIKLWDTETGACLSRFSTGRIPHVVRFNPALDGAHQFLVGTSDHKIICFDTRSGDQTQEYDHHLQAVNTITFCTPARSEPPAASSKTLRFVTTSDDKSLRAWEYDIPVPIKFISDPSHFPLTRAALHPGGKHLALQRADNQIVVHKAVEGFQQHKHKAFRGHNTAGYAVDLDFSPDGRWVVSGDSGGWVCFWDWHHGRMVHKMMAGGDGGDGRGGKGGKAVTCVAWHPRETSKVATAGLEGVIKYWD